TVGDMLLFEFENERTLRYQVQEMVYTERLTEPTEVAHEVEMYRRLLPDSHSLTVTMFIELDDLATVRDELRRLDGVQNSVLLEIGHQCVYGIEIRGIDEVPDTPSET